MMLYIRGPEEIYGRQQKTETGRECPVLVQAGEIQAQREL